MKLCIDCRFYGQTRWCLHESTIVEYRPDTGELSRGAGNALAYNQRQYPHWIALLAGRCGSRARFFEPKERK